MSSEGGLRARSYRVAVGLSYMNDGPQSISDVFSKNVSRWMPVIVGDLSNDGLRTRSRSAAETHEEASLGEMLTFMNMSDELDEQFDCSKNASPRQSTPSEPSILVVVSTRLIASRLALR